MSALAPRPKYPTAKFEMIGTIHSGRVVEEPEDRHARKYNSTDLDYWPDGSPVIQTRIVLEPTNGGERFAIYAKGRMAQAIRQALAQAQAGDIEIGGVLSVKYDRAEPSKGGGQPAKCYVATYQPPAVSPHAEAAGDPWANEPWPDDEPPF